MKRLQFIFAAALAVVVALFFGIVHPELLCFHEQNQLFLVTRDYLVARLSEPGGLADYLSEFFVQFYFHAWLGAAVLGVLFAAFYLLTVANLRSEKSLPKLILALIPSFLAILEMATIDALLSHFVAILIALVVSALRQRSTSWLPEVLIAPILYWLIGPVAWLYLALRIFDLRIKVLFLGVYLLLCQLFAYRFMLTQRQLLDALCGLNYYRITMHHPASMFVLPVGIFVLFLVERLFSASSLRAVVLSGVVSASVGIYSVVSYDSDLFFLLRQNMLVRQERWSTITDDARQLTVRTPMYSQAVNLALAMQRRLADDVFTYYQSGADALIMPTIRDNVSCITSAEAFFRLGMVNSSLRYFSDIQESIVNGRKSGRFTQRIAQCYIVNGNYAVARKHLTLLRNTLFYSDWAAETQQLLKNERSVDAHPVYGQMRRNRLKDDFFYDYGQKAKIFGQLFVANPENLLALDYFLVQALLDADAETFMNHLSWAEHYGKYAQMPRGYLQAVKTIRSGDRSTDYAAYLSRHFSKQNN